MRFPIAIEPGDAATAFGVVVPDLPGCISTGDTLEDIERNIREAIAFHLDGLREDGLPIPEPFTVVEYCELAA